MKDGDDIVHHYDKPVSEHQARISQRFETTEFAGTVAEVARAHANDFATVISPHWISGLALIVALDKKGFTEADGLLAHAARRAP
jgi:hypothetical protein